MKFAYAAIELYEFDDEIEGKNDSDNEENSDEDNIWFILFLFRQKYEMKHIKNKFKSFLFLVFVANIEGAILECVTATGDASMDNSLSRTRDAGSTDMLKSSEVI